MHARRLSRRKLFCLLVSVFLPTIAIAFGLSGVLTGSSGLPQPLLASSACLVACVSCSAALLAHFLSRSIVLDAGLDELSRSIVLDSGPDDSVCLDSESLEALADELLPALHALAKASEQLIELPLAPQQRRLADAVREHVGGMLQLLNAFLDCRRLEAGVAVPEKEPFVLHSCVEGVLARLSDKAEKKGIELIPSIDPALPYKVVGDARRLEQALFIFAESGLKATERDWLEVSVWAEQGGSALACRIRDSGAWVAEEKMLGRQDCDSRLSLDVGFRLIQLMGGTVEASACGACFFLVLPLQAEAHAPHPPWMISPVPELAGLSLLMVIDNTPLELSLTRHLHFFGLHVLACSVSRLDSLNLANQLDLMLIDGSVLKHLDRRAREQLKQLSEGTAAPPVLLVAGPEGSRMEEHSSFLSQQPIALGKPATCKALFQALLRSRTVHRHKQAAFKKARVLVAEDNRTNQLLVRGLLLRLGCRADAVSNGAEAVQAVLEIGYDLVLMDVNMPVMDGIEATRRIRADLPAERQPMIVAVTADATSECRARCRWAGMDDFVNYPYTKAEFERVLAACPDKGQLGSAPAHSGSGGWAAASASAVLVDMEKLDELCQLSDELSDPDKDASMVEELFSAYREEARKSMDALSRLVRQQDFLAASAEAHKLRGLCLNLGLPAMAALAEALEHHAPDQHDVLPELMEHLEEQYMRTNKMLDEAFKWQE